MILPVAKYPDEILRAETVEVKFPLSPSMKKLAKDMLDTVRKEKGIGLAAPQVFKSAKLIIVNLEHMGLPPFALFNPEITSSSRIKDTMEEGCLSIPGVYGMVERPSKIKFQGRDLDGNEIKAECEGMLSKVIQHEIDHINGILIIDKISKFTKGEAVLKKMEQKKK
jgi:peptide deformylase